MLTAAEPSLRISLQQRLTVLSNGSRQTEIALPSAGPVRNAESLHTRNTDMQQLSARSPSMNWGDC